MEAAQDCRLRFRIKRRNKCSEIDFNIVSENWDILQPREPRAERGEIHQHTWAKHHEEQKEDHQHSRSVLAWENNRHWVAHWETKSSHSDSSPQQSQVRSEGGNRVKEEVSESDDERVDLEEHKLNQDNWPVEGAGSIQLLKLFSEIKSLKLREVQDDPKSGGEHEIAAEEERKAQKVGSLLESDKTVAFGSLPPKRGSKKESKSGLEYLNSEDDGISHHEFEVTSYQFSKLNEYRSWLMRLNHVCVERLRVHFWSAGYVFNDLRIQLILILAHQIVPLQTLTRNRVSQLRSQCHFHNEVSWVSEASTTESHTLEVTQNISRSALIDDMPSVHKNHSIQTHEDVRRWLVDWGDHSPPLSALSVE